MRRSFIVLLLLAAGCTERVLVEPAPVARVVTDAASYSLGPGDTLHLAAILVDEAGNELFDRTITWRSSDTMLLRVDTAGIIVGVAEGMTRVIVASEGIEDTLPVHVIRAWESAMPLTWQGGIGCLRRPTGALYCWGRYGLAGVPESLATPLKFMQLDGGDFHACGVAVGGSGFCWGDDSKGLRRLGFIAPEGFTSTPTTPVSGGLTFAKLSAGGEHSCGMVADKAYCWGRGLEGQMGRGGTSGGVVPDSVHGLPPIRDVQAGWRNTCALDQSGVVWCWGLRFLDPSDPQSSDYVTLPLQVQGLPLLDTIAIQDDYGCGLTAMGAAWCWGVLDEPGLASGSELGPITIGGGQSFTSLALTGQSVCGLTSAGAAFCWGRGGWLGDGTFEGSTVPVPVVGAPPFVRIYGGGYGVCGITPGGSAWCWGAQGLFDGSGERPRQVPDL